MVEQLLVAQPKFWTLQIKMPRMPCEKCIVATDRLPQSQMLKSPHDAEVDLAWRQPDVTA